MAKSLKVRGVFYFSTSPPPLSHQLCSSQGGILNPASRYWNYFENFEIKQNKTKQCLGSPDQSNENLGEQRLGLGIFLKTTPKRFQVWKPRISLVHCSSKCGPRPVASESCGKLWKMQILRPHSRPTESETLGVQGSVFQQSLQMMLVHAHI